MAPDQKKAIEEDRTVVFVDESGFYLLPAVLSTYSPIGKTPIIKEHVSREHLSAIGGITADGKLYMMVQERAYNGVDVVEFLRRLLGHIHGKLTIIWDGAPIHRGQVVKEFLSDGGAARIHLERLPGYAPDLNPAEGIWNYLKRVELKNLCCQDIAQLRYELRKAKERLRHKTSVIKGCVSQPGFY